MPDQEKIERLFDGFETATSRIALLSEVLSDLAWQPANCDIDVAKNTLMKIRTVCETLDCALGFAESIADDIEAEGGSEGSGAGRVVVGSSDQTSA